MAWDLFESKQKITFSGFFRKHSSGIYGTIIFHLTVAVILLSSQIYASIGEREAIVLVFPPEEETFVQAQTVRPQQTNHPAAAAPVDRREQLSKELDRLIAGKTPRNVALDVSQERRQPLRDDRHTNVAQLYAEAREVQRRIDAARRETVLRQGADNVAAPAAPSPPPAQESYKGPSVLSYDLGGREHLSLPVPVYQCLGGGDVAVQIEVNQRGYVTSVVIQIAASVDNLCLYEAAKRAALRSRFTVDANAPVKQKGNIVYRFIPQ
ncbi:MAG: hypothetical protein LBN98_03430 [Prevotellaceae bacterium]|jgi:hypothetical protein|nr:hypothetical protein [Prevotellaceae bacterium]